MNRAEMVEKGAAALRVCTCAEGFNQHGPWRRVDEDCPSCGWGKGKVQAVLDAVLPQVTTVEELEALPDLTRLVSRSGYWLVTVRRSPDIRFVLDDENWTAEAVLKHFGPLTVVWTP